MAHLGEIWAKISRVATEEISCHYCSFDINFLDLTAIFAVLVHSAPGYAFRPRAQARGAKIFTRGTKCRDMSRHLPRIRDLWCHVASRHLPRVLKHMT